jgi:cytochrome P450
MLDPANAADPHPLWARLRRLGGVVPGLFGSVQAVRRAEVEAVLQTPTVFSSAMEAVDLGQSRPLIPLQVDPPEHVRYRRLLDPAFSPREMARLEPAITRLVNDLIDAFAGRGRCELGSELAVPLPSSVFLVLMGLPLSDLDSFLEMKDGILRPRGSTFEEARESQRRWAERIDAYFAGALAERSRRRRSDLLSRLIDAEVGGERLSNDEILGMCFLLLLAGLDTVTDALECSFAYLARHPDQQRLLASQPALIPAAVEELLRHETPVVSVSRVARVDTELGGCPIRAGTRVGVNLGAANNDEAAVEDPDSVLFARNPNRHLAFGGGVHRCLGSHLARLELRVALREWHRRIPCYRLAPDVELVFTPALRQVEFLPLEWEPQLVK